LLDTALEQELKETYLPRAVPFCGVSQGPQTRGGKGGRDALAGDGKYLGLAYPHFGLSLGLCFHSQGLPDFSRQLHVVTVVVRDRD